MSSLCRTPEIGWKYRGNEAEAGAGKGFVHIDEKPLEQIFCQDEKNRKKFAFGHNLPSDSGSHPSSPGKEKGRRMPSARQLESNRPSRQSRSGYKLLSAPCGRYRVAGVLLRAACTLVLIQFSSPKQKRTADAVRFCFGGDSWNRTNDLMHVKHAL